MCISSMRGAGSVVDPVKAGIVMRDAVVKPSVREVGLVDLGEVRDDRVDVVGAGVSTERAQRAVETVDVIRVRVPVAG